MILAVILLSNKFFNIFAAENDITNTATIYYNEGGVDKSAQSNTVTTLVVTPSTMQIFLNLQGRSDHSISNGWLRIYNAGTSTLVFEKNDISLDSSGEGQVNISGLTSGQHYDRRFKAKYFLTSFVPDVEYSANFGAIFGLQQSGDLDDNNIINSIDFGHLSNEWGQSGVVSDINEDGVVNSIDFSFLNMNWFKQGS